MKRRDHRHARTGGFTITDILSIVVIFFILGSLCNAGIDLLRNTTRSSQLSSNIRSLNEAVYLFRASGGDLSDALTPEQVISKMQATEVDRLTLTINSILIHGLKPVYQSSREARSEASRAFWNAEAQAFEMARTGDAGIKAFEKEDSP